METEKLYSDYSAKEHIELAINVLRENGLTGISAVAFAVKELEKALQKIKVLRCAYNDMLKTIDNK